jgi:hypothetical protein
VTNQANERSVKILILYQCVQIDCMPAANFVSEPRQVMCKLNSFQVLHAMNTDQLLLNPCIRSNCSAGHAAYCSAGQWPFLLYTRNWDLARMV